MKILVVNVHYPPVAFGGATIVTEQTTTRLSKISGVQCLVLCLDSAQSTVLSLTTRYNWQGVDVIATSPVTDLTTPNYERNGIARLNREIIEQYMPDVALIHCVQDFGAEFITHLFELGVPVAIFVHDAWWLCERQFMVNRNEGYCFQTKINLEVCRYCVDDIVWTRRRSDYLQTLINRADVRLFPSGFFRDLHISSGVKQDRSIVLKNGVLQPRALRTAIATPPKSGGSTVRFGFLGGVGPIKGFALVQSVFATLPRSDYELVCVDNMTNLGRRSSELECFECTGRVRVRDGFTQDSIDEFYDEIDVLLCPSQWKESFGLAVREALIRHKWVIVTDAGGIAEDVVPEVNGTIIPMLPDPEFLRSAVLRCFDRDWSQYRNLYAEKIRTFDEQTEELHRILCHLATDKITS